MPFTRAFALALFFAAAFLMPPPASGQATSLWGTVKDETGGTAARSAACD